MKFITFIALLGATQAINLNANSQAAFVDDIVKALAESDKQEISAAKKPEAVAKNTTTIKKANATTNSTKK